MFKKIPPVFLEKNSKAGKVVALETPVQRTRYLNPSPTQIQVKSPLTEDHLEEFKNPLSQITAESELEISEIHSDSSFDNTTISNELQSTPQDDKKNFEEISTSLSSSCENIELKKGYSSKSRPITTDIENKLFPLLWSHENKKGQNCKTKIRRL